METKHTSTENTNARTRVSFTPGPWHADIWGGSEFQRGAVETLAEPVRVICDIPKFPYSEMTENDANARLIAAAPDLLAALERIANSVAIGAASKHLHTMMRACFTAIEQEARAAIAKATGQA